MHKADKAALAYISRRASDYGFRLQITAAGHDSYYAIIDRRGKVLASGVQANEYQPLIAFLNGITIGLGLAQAKLN